MRRGAAIVTTLVLLLAACGGGNGGSRLSANAYGTQLAKIRQQAATAQAHVALLLRAKSIPELRQRLDAFGTATAHLGDEVAKLNPPQNAEAANTELADGLHETARATHSASAQVAKLHTPKEAIAYLQQSNPNQKGAREVNEAFKKLQKLGYANDNR